MFFTWKKKYWKSLKTPRGSDVWVRGRTAGYWCASSFWEYVKYHILLLTIERCLLRRYFCNNTIIFMDFTRIQRGLLLSDQFINIPPNFIVLDFVYFHRSSLLVMCLNTFLFRRNQPGTNPKVSDVFKLEKSYYRIQPWTAWGYRKAQNKPWIMGI